MKIQKIRVWDKSRNTFLNENSLIFTNESIYENYRGFEDDIPINERATEVVRSIGEFDSYGKEIFENDIIEAEYHNFSLRFLVKETSCGFKFVTDSGDEWRPENVLFDKTVIIGNALQAPELLEEAE